ncbi:hypothetical protein [Dickeya chrysanthemi]|uniref:hypothetical protein n=1 Tax=Dickeya chrysanthemi TaxID=556 RepID=UPI000586B33A|nr:hypothetical protein [Dickeya chrysanthemi]MBX9448061.1 hypothetical protein [Dickeya chrysanthemi]
MAKDTKRGSALVSALKGSSISELGKEYAELGIDSLLESKALESIPFINTLVAIYKTAGTFRDQLLTEKLVRFLTAFADHDDAERIKMIDRLNENDKFAGKAGARLIEIIDRMESERKPEIAATFLKAFSREEIKFLELRRLLVALERIPTFDIDNLPQFSRSTFHETVNLDEAMLLAIVNAGLGKNNGGWDGGAIVPTQLCKTFVQVIKLEF